MSLKQFRGIVLGDAIQTAKRPAAILLALARLDAIPAVGADVHRSQLAEVVPIRLVHVEPQGAVL